MMQHLEPHQLWEKFQEHQPLPVHMEKDEKVRRFPVFSPGWKCIVKADNTQIKKLVKREWDRLMAEKDVDNVKNSTKKRRDARYIAKFFRRRKKKHAKKYKLMCTAVTKYMADVAGKQLEDTLKDQTNGGC
ncbi:hypothetical protein L1049_019905 [Liquidambar formosana]|uniref:Uncharacterized protein n=1 Tax=Liquidambar formosana TaxID=63359 RepID=A0AAP0X9H6_LIQFO